MFEKEVTRKQFIISTISIFALLALSGLPKLIVNKISKPKSGVATTANSYGNQVYGGVQNA